MKKYNLIAFAVMLIILSSVLVLAEDVQIVKTAPDEIKLGSNLAVNINVINNGNSKININLQETITEADPIDPSKFESQEVPTNPNGTGPHGLIAARPPYYQWKIEIEPKSEKLLIYVIHPLNPGYYSISPTVGSIGNQKFSSNSLLVKVTCNKNAICEKSENYLNCPEDCPSGSSDGVCDSVRDSKCDSDCNKEADVDCMCGDKTCQNFENYKTCPSDCSLSFFEKIINWIKSLFG